MSDGLPTPKTQRCELNRIRFPFEELTVWQKALDFAESVIGVTGNINTDRRHFRLLEQLESAAASVAANIAEGKGRYSKKEFIQYLYVARGSLFEAITFLTIFNRKSWIEDEQLDNFKILADEINKMISSLVKAIRNSLVR